METNNEDLVEQLDQALLDVLSATPAGREEAIDAALFVAAGCATDPSRMFDAMASQPL